jgi:predicted ATPase
MSYAPEVYRPFVEVVSDVAWAQAERRAVSDRSLSLFTLAGGWVYAGRSRAEVDREHGRKPRNDGSWF